MHLLGKAFLVMPDWPELSPVSIELSWRLPDGWVAINSLGLGEGAQRFSGSLFQLRQGVYVAGDFRLRRFEIRGKPAAVALRGRWGFTDDEFATFVNRIVAAQRAFWKDDDLPKGANLDPSFRYLFFHELFHTWNPNKLTHSGGVPPALYWFSEGFTDYYAYVLQMLEGFESFPDHMDRMTKIMSRYWTWRTRNLPNHAAAQDYYSDPEAQKVAYFRGTLVALNWNAAIREASQGKSSLNDFMRALKSRVERTHEELTHAVLVSEAERFGIGGAEKQIARWIDHGDTVEVRSDSFGPCAEMIGTDPPQFRIARQQCVEWFK
ncbi:MAG: hypothetical protein IT168_26680 [Bryobacterales bacterium]|nr:hypothetical protein [Bryobacterales bacterium]